MARKPGLGSPAGARQNLEGVAAEHQRNHQGEKRPPVTQDGPKVTHPTVAGRPDPSGPAYRESTYDPSCEAMRG
jgi:hypothetical protein